MTHHLQNKKIKTVLLALLLGLSGTANLVAQNITFADANVKAICVEPETGWDNNGDGELSYAEAAAVTSIGTVFKGKTNIQSFNELQHFISLTAIDERAFMGCTALAEITIPENIATIGDKAFVNCHALATVHFNAINCTSMSTVYNEENYSVFISNASTFPLTNLTIGSRVQSIPDYAFRGCDQIQSLDIPASVTTIGQYAFHDCTSLETLTIGGGVVGEYAFYGCTGLEELTIGEGVTSIGNYAFHSCTNLATLTIGEDMASIGDYAFYGCTSLEILIIDGGEVRQYAFYGCTSLEELTIGEGVTSIYGYAFWDCPALTTVHFNAVNCTYMKTFASTSGGSLNDFYRSVFNETATPIVNLTIGENVTRIPDHAFKDSPSVIGNLTLPNSVTSIGECAFYNCSGLTGSLTLPNSVTSIGDYAFRDCSGFTGSLVIPNSVTSIGSYAFYGCRGFNGSLIIPNSVTSIGGGAFHSCWGFTGNLVIPNSVTSIEHGTFQDCWGFNGSLVIPNSVTSIGEAAFAYCSGFTALITESLAVPTAVEYYGTYPFYAFDHMNYDIPVYVPAGKVSEYQNAAGWNVFTNYKSQINFEQDSNDQWSDDFNWSSWEVPGPEDVVCITENCQLDTDANVLYVYIADNEKVLTVNSGQTLNTTYGVHIENASQLVVEDGAQVKSDIPFSGTVQKHIDAYTSSNDGWNFIASPVAEELVTAEVPGLVPTGGTVYDLYYLDEESTTWMNYKNHTFTTIPNQGYLYANQAGTTINFSGTMQPYVAEGVSIPLTKEGQGWNLVGNPFTFNAYANKPYYVINGRSVEAAASGTIAPCTGIIVKAIGTENEAVTFTKDAPAASSAPSNGSLQVVLAEANNTRGAIQIDNAIVSFNEGETLPKFRFGDNAQIYLPQGNEDYAIACAEKTGELPLNFKAAKNGEYTLTVNPEDVEMEYLHLIDNMTGADVDLLATPTYTFNAKTTDYASRFRLVFSANSVSENADSDNEAFAFVSNGEIVFTNAEAGATLQIVDMMGRIVVSSDVARNVSTSDIPAGVYVLRLINGDNVRTQKMMIE